MSDSPRRPLSSKPFSGFRTLSRSAKRRGGWKTLFLQGAAVCIIVGSLTLWFTSGHGSMISASMQRRVSLLEDQYTVVISSYARDEALKETLKELSRPDHPSLHSVVIVWHNPKRQPPRDVLELIKTLSINVIIRRPQTDSLNNRFLPGTDIRTRAVMSRDDDLYFAPGDTEFQFRQWQIYGKGQRMVGTAPREIIPNPKEGGPRFIYRMKDLKKYEIILTNAAFMDISFLERYWADNEAARTVREHVDRNMNCEDIAMNFFAANATGLPPLLVETKEPRRYYRSSGISSSPTHFQTRAACYDDFLELFGGMHLPSSTEIIKRSGSEIRDYWDSIPPPAGEGIEDKPSANEQKHMALISAEIEDLALTSAQREKLHQQKDELIADLQRKVEILQQKIAKH